MKRSASLARIADRTEPWDLLVVGGGATGMGIAVDAATRGLDVLLCEKFDFGKGTSSRSTKLVHGGVRYLRQGNLTLVRDALRERTRLRRNAPHLVRDMPFFIPCQSRLQRWYYGLGLTLYDALAPRHPFGRTRSLSQSAARRLIPAIQAGRNHGGVIYHDGQFDDARLLIHLARTAADAGACLVNYASVAGLQKDDAGRIRGADILDTETNASLEVRARCVVNAAGPFSDAVRRLDNPEHVDRIAASQGIHLVLPSRYFPGEVAMIVPKTSDGRVLFVIPWHGHAIVGTTDTPVVRLDSEPEATIAEISFLLRTLSEYLDAPPALSDLLSVFVGIRPLVKGDTSARTASLSRDHRVVVDRSGLLTVLGGKWTTYRKMAEDCVDSVIAHAGLRAGPCRTARLPLHGAPAEEDFADMGGLLDPQSAYGTDGETLRRIEATEPTLGELLHPDLPLRGSHIVLAVREEMARTIEDVLCRRTRCLFLNARATIEIAPAVARMTAGLLERDEVWAEDQVAAFTAMAQKYLPPRNLDGESAA